MPTHTSYLEEPYDLYTSPLGGVLGVAISRIVICRSIRIAVVIAIVVVRVVVPSTGSTIVTRAPMVALAVGATPSVGVTRVSATFAGHRARQESRLDSRVKRRR